MELNFYHKSLQPKPFKLRLFYQQEFTFLNIKGLLHRVTTYEDICIIENQSLWQKLNKTEISKVYDIGLQRCMH